MATRMVNGVEVTLTSEEASALAAENSTLAASLAAIEYKFQRLGAYPQLCDQLDMLWHAIDNNALDQTSDFYLELKAVKDTYPKPE